MNCWVDEQDAVYPNDGTFCRKKEWGTDPCYNMDRAVWKKPDTTSHMLWLHLYEMSTTGKSRETESSLVVAKDSEKEGMQRHC